MVPYVFTTFVLGLVFTLSVFYLVRRSKLSVPYALWWLTIALLILGASIFPQALDALGHFLGVSYPPILFVIVALLVLAFRIFFADIHRTDLEVKLRNMAQNQAQLTGKIAQFERLVAQYAKASSTSDSKTL